MRSPNSDFESVERDDEAQEPHDRRGRGLQSSVPSTRTSVSWTFVAIAIIALVVMLVFIIENLHATDATFLASIIRPTSGGTTRLGQSWWRNADGAMSAPGA